MNYPRYFLKIAAGLLLGGTSLKADINTLKSAVVNNTVPNAQSPGGLVRVGEKGLLAVFSDAGDLQPGAKAYLVRSDNLGKSWGEPFKVLESAQPNIGIGAVLGGLPDGRILLAQEEVNHHSDDRTWDAVFKSRSCSYSLSISTDGGQTFVNSGTLPSAPNAMGGIMGAIVPLPNGDLIWPAYQYPGGTKEEGYAYGSGFFRSKDGGKTWGALEVAFTDPVPGKTKELGFSEAAYVSRPDGTIVGYARIDSETFDPGPWQAKGNNLWCVESHDNGQTWSTPKETSIGGLYPALLRLTDEQYIMACGDRHDVPTRKVNIFASPNALDFKRIGYAPYALTKGECISSATGGSQFMVKIDKDTAYLIYYAGDPALKTRDCTFIEGCLIRIH